MKRERRVWVALSPTQHTAGVAVFLLSPPYLLISLISNISYYKYILILLLNINHSVNISILAIYNFLVLLQRFKQKTLYFALRLTFTNDSLQSSVISLRIAVIILTLCFNALGLYIFGLLFSHKLF